MTKTAKTFEDKIKNQALKVVLSPMNFFGVEIKNIVDMTGMQHKETGRLAFNMVLENGNVHWTPPEDGGFDAYETIGDKSQTFGQITLYDQAAVAMANAIEARTNLTAFALIGFNENIVDIAKIKENLETINDVAALSNPFKKKAAVKGSSGPNQS